MSRRRFIKSLASAPLLPVAFAAPQRPAPLPPASTPAPPPPPPTAAPSPTGTPPGPAAQALGEVVRIRYGPQLEEADLSEVKKAIDSTDSARVPPLQRPGGSRKQTPRKEYDETPAGP